MRVLLISLRYRGGGAERCARELFHRLPEVGVEAEMWVADRSLDDPGGVRAMRYGWERTFDGLDAVPHWTDWRHRGSIQKLDAIRSGDFDLAHLHVIHSGCASIRAIRRLATRIPTVWTFHDEWAVTGGNCFFMGDRISPWEIKRLTAGVWRYTPYHSYHENFRFRGLRKFLAHAMPQPKSIICPSRYLLDATRQCGRFPHAQLFWIPYGVEMLRQSPSTVSRSAARESLGLSVEMPTVLLIAANLDEPRKGIQLAAEAIQLATASHPVQVLLLGKATREMSVKFGQSRVVSTYAADDETLIRAYRSADLTLVPSLADNLPYVALESLACETPVLAFRVGGLPEIVGDDERGSLVDAFDVPKLGTEMVRLLTDSAARRAKGEAGCRWIQEHCNPTPYLAAVKYVYETTLS